MKRNGIFIGIIVLCCVLRPFFGLAQERHVSGEYTFTMEYEVGRTPVKDQGNTGTCWCFATLSFLESEILRTGGEPLDLSEMFLVRHLYPHKAMNYFRQHGNTVFGQGSLSHDALFCLREYGIVPEEVYDGRKRGESVHDHAEMYAMLKAMLETTQELSSGEVTPLWREAFTAVLDVYLGAPPERFSYRGKEYTPVEFAETHVNVDLSNYVELTSFSHHPFYEKIRLEIPDNWSFYDEYINVPIDELEIIVDYALKNGHSLAWDGDMSEEDYADSDRRHAIVPADEGNDTPGAPAAEKTITQELRQRTFDNYSTTDDHLMHIFGIARDQHGKKYYVAKDSWFSEEEHEGLIYLSRSYFRLKTVAILINREILPADIVSKIVW